ncbi:pyrroloquinoline-quinone synthase PqqC [Geminicoccus roseus]|uniref:pyrroloquinoline-quinone synthase PqqC n=1 Tax=Geminicoccus roseus TaxID=404900 RepID=UPI00042808BA|nr:pyrroloquinoline-quinone synthase PqqC [Geminicoccus roseus]
MTERLGRGELEAALRQVGAERYHHLHPFHQRLHGGACSRGEVQAWALNRYYYQSMIPVKDAAVLGQMRDPALRRAWRQRIVDHDGDRDGEGGIARWLALTDGVGLDRDLVVSTRAVLPTTRFAVEAYVAFCRDRTLLEAIASSLTELFSPQIIGERIAGMLAHYDFVDQGVLAYFTARPPQAERDSAFALAYVLEHAVTPETQAAALAALSFKTEVLWAQLDGLWMAYVEGRPPPGAWRPAP